MTASATVLLLGASVRALAFSALRAGLQPWCADLFGDTDLQARCPAFVLPMSEYPEGFYRFLGTAPAGPVIYTGGLENYPRLLSRIGASRTMWSNPGAVVRRVRSPFAVAELLRQQGFPHARVARAPEVGGSQRWLAKPLRGAGGRGIHPVQFPGLSSRGTGAPPVSREEGPSWPGSSTVVDVPSADRRDACATAQSADRRDACATTQFSQRRGWYYQEFIPGEAQSALYLGLAERTILLGVSWQLVGETWLHAAPFQYCGSIGPLPLAPALEAQYRQLGEALGSHFGLRGLFGVDCVVNDDRPHVVEVNPRYTASVEVHELATGRALLAQHVQAFGAPVPVMSSGDVGGVVGKAIVYAPRDCIFRGVEGGALSAGPWQAPLLADIPYPGQHHQVGQPILTVFAQAGNVEDCAAGLQQRVQELRERL